MCYEHSWKSVEIHFCSLDMIKCCMFVDASNDDDDDDGDVDDDNNTVLSC